MNGARILVVRLGAMGDVLHAAPSVASLKQSFPNSHIAWAIEPRWAELLEGNPFVDELVFVNRRSLGELMALRKRLRAGRYTIAVDFQGLIKSALVANFARPDRIYGLHRSCAREPLASLFYSHAVRPHSVHVVDRWLEIAAAAGAHRLVRTAWVPPGKPEGDLPTGPFILANPLAGWKSKQWPLEHYIELARLLGERCKLVLNVPEAIDVPGVHVHVSSIAGLIDATRRSSGVVGVDSGPLHLAAALGKPGVALFGPTDPARNGPYGGTFTVLRRSEAATSYKRKDEIDPSMCAIRPEEVFAALQERLRW
jgi:heptosyltransferase-1